MEESQGSSHSLPPFLTKTYEMVDDPSTNSVVSWSPSNKSFIVWNPLDFSRDLLPGYFKHNNFSSFIRQLNTYGFRKIDPQLWEFANDDFIRGKPHLMKSIHRRKPVHSHSLQNLQGQGSSSSPVTDSERQGFEDEIVRLKQEKEILISVFQTNEHECKEFEQKVQILTERLRLLEQGQKNLVSFLAHVLQKLGLSLDLVPQSENRDRKSRLTGIGCFYDDAREDENPRGSSQAVNLERLEHIESSLIFWENIVRDASQTRMPWNSDLLDLDESTSCVDTLALCRLPLIVECQTKSPGIDMNSEPVVPAAPEPVGLKEQAGETSTPVTAPEPVGLKEQAGETSTPVTAPEPVGLKEQAGETSAPVTNDVFWEQFLTEDPVLTDNQEAQANKNDDDGRKNKTKPSDRGRFWWNVKRINNLAEQMGHLTPTQKT